MSGTPVATDLSYPRYLRSLKGIDGMPAPVLNADGSTMFRVAEDHFLVIACAMHDEHAGHQQIAATVMPKDWVCFSQFFSEDGRWDYFHYGPDLEGRTAPSTHPDPDRLDRMTS